MQANAKSSLCDCAKSRTPDNADTKEGNTTMAKMLVAINAINHAPVIHNTVMGEPISPNIKITATYEIACDFIIKKSSFVILTTPVMPLHLPSQCR